MEHLEYFEPDSIIEKADSLIDELFTDVLNEEVDALTLSAGKQAGKRTFKNYVGQIIGWTAFFPLSLIRALYKTIRKKNQIKKLVKQEKDPEKKVILRRTLKGISSKQVKLVKDIEHAKAKARKKASKGDKRTNKEDIEAQKSTQAFKEFAAAIKAENAREQ